MIPDETIARVREGVDLVELVRESVMGLKKAGRGFTARCPFHQERTPSFHVNPDMGVFKCFGCGVGGDAFKFVMLMESLTYPEAIRKLAGRVGVVIEEDRAAEISAEGQEKQKLYGLMEDAARFYHRHFMESPEAAVAREYLAARGVSKESLVRFSIGFAPASGNALRDAALRKGHALEILEKAGLSRRKEGSGRVYDHFWNRIIFPIWDTQGRIIAFGGRAMGDAMPKYINSPETPIYSKSRHLYGLFQGLATFRKRRHAVILEGYMDVVVCHQFGIDYTAATLGTALTDEHVRLLRRYSDRVTLLFDPDAAGAQASLRGGELLIGESFTVDVVTLPNGLDPDEILVQEGKDALEAHLAKATPFIDYFMEQSMARHPGLTPESKLAVARDVLPLIRRMRDPLLQDEHLGRVANLLRVEKGILAQQMKRVKAEPDAQAAVAPVISSDRKMLSAEEEIILLALCYPTETTAERIDALEWSDDRARQVWTLLRESVAAGHVLLADVLSKLPDDVQGWLNALPMYPRDYKSPDDVLTGLLNDCRRQQESAALQRLKIQIDLMIEGRIPMDQQMVQSYNDLSRRLKGSKAATSH